MTVEPRPARLRAESPLRAKPENGGSLGTAARTIDGLDMRSPGSALPDRHHGGTWRGIAVAPPRSKNSARPSQRANRSYGGGSCQGASVRGGARKRDRGCDRLASQEGTAKAEGLSRAAGRRLCGLHGHTLRRERRGRLAAALSRPEARGRASDQARG